MADKPAIHPAVIEFGNLLAKKTDEERHALVRAATMRALAQKSDEDIGKPPVATLGEYLDREIETPPMLVGPGIIARGAITLLSSRGGKGKTTFSLNALMRWSMGKPAYDERPDDLVPQDGPLKIIVIENEGSGGHFQAQLSKILDENGYSDEEKQLARENMHIWGDGGWSGLKFDNPEDIVRVRAALEEIQPDVLFIEPFRGLWKGDEDSSTEMSNVLDQISGLANEFDCGVFITHHERKGGAGEDDAMSAVRGSTAFEGHAAVMFRWISVQAGRYRELVQTKHRFDQPVAPLRLEYDFERHSYKPIGEDEQERQVLAALLAADDYLTVGEIAEEMDGEKRENVRKILRRLNDEDRVIRQSAGGSARYRYRRPDEKTSTDDQVLSL